MIVFFREQLDSPLSTVNLYDGHFERNIRADIRCSSSPLDACSTSPLQHPEGMQLDVSSVSPIENPLGAISSKSQWLHGANMLILIFNTMKRSRNPCLSRIYD